MEKLFTSDNKIVFNGFDRFKTSASKHKNLFTVCFNKEDIILVNSKKRTEIKMNQVDIKYHEDEKQIPETWIYHHYIKDNGMNIVLEINNN
jgi:hypothetical protein